MRGFCFLDVLQLAQVQVFSKVVFKQLLASHHNYPQEVSKLFERFTSELNQPAHISASGLLNLALGQAEYARLRGEYSAQVSAALEAR